LSDATPSVWSAWCDGGSRGNPGPSAFGVVLCDPAGAVAAEIGRTIGVNTNQVAEYEALICALEEMRSRGARRVRVFTDSEFVVKQVTGVYRAKDERMKALLARVRAVAAAFESLDLKHIPRSSHPHNVKADKLVNAVLDEAKSKA
jgi:ribonuclease HI